MTKSKKIKDHLIDQEALLVEQLEKYYGIEYNGDPDTFIEDANRTAKDFAKRKQNEDNIEHAAFEGKIGELRHLWADNLKKPKDTPKQAEVRKAIEDEKLAVAISFPDEHSCNVHASGKEDSGHIDMPKTSIIAAVHRLVNPDELT